MYHPAAAFRAGAVMQQFQEDFKKLPKIVERLKDQKKEKKRRPRTRTSGLIVKYG